MKNKKIIIAVVALVLVAAAMLGVYFATRPGTEKGSKAITVTVVHSDGKEKSFSYRTDEEYLGPVLIDRGLVKGENGEFGLYIQEVDGERAVWEEDQAYWALYIGSEYATTGADTTPIKDGDSFRLVYEGG